MIDIGSKFVKFITIGAFSTLLHFLILFLLTLKPLVSPPLASAVGYLVSSVANYYLNYRFTFQHTGAHSTTILKFYIMVFIGLLINSLTFKSISLFFDAHPVIIQVPTTAIVLGWNFTVSHLWTYKNIREND